MVQKKRILLIEDEEQIATLIKLQAELRGYTLHVEVDGLNGYNAIEREKPDLVILDVMLPGLNGLDVCRRIRNNPSLKQIPIIMLTAKDKELDVVLALELGADDYVTKPFSPSVLFARVKAVFRRKNTSEKNTQSKKDQERVVKFGHFTLEIDRYTLRKNDEIIPLTLSELGILKRLLIHKGQVFTRNQLLDNIQNEDALVVDRNIDVHIASLRKKLGPNFDSIETVRGIGYRFKDTDEITSY